MSEIETLLEELTTSHKNPAARRKVVAKVYLEVAERDAELADTKEKLADSERHFKEYVQKIEALEAQAKPEPTFFERVGAALHRLNMWAFQRGDD